MATLKDIRRRIGSVKSTQKITRAMKMVAAAKLRKAQEKAENFRAYADLSASILIEVAAGATAEDHPLLERRPEPSRSLLLVIGADRGLCGGFNSNLNRDVLALLKETAARGELVPELDIIGRKPKEFFARRDAVVRQFHAGVYDSPDYGTAARIARELSGSYEAGEIDRIDLEFNEMVSMVSQKPVRRPLLPIALPERTDDDGPDQGLRPVGFIFEPGRRELLARLLPLYVEVQIYRALLESIAAEQAARMTAMDNATNNAADMIEHLTLVYNRARQSAITSELMDIVGGAEALGE
ncbi:MAG TPA: ATP synthase F1 subunit gamma [Polyangia bacterium]|nr:ATP synthase F1 subunit gamma [Polyangia bacterium]